MALETVIQEVLSRGRAEADDVLKAAQAERERILQDARAEGAKLLERREREAKEAAERLLIQALARAELESKKIVLSAQKELLDEVYARVLDRLGRMEESREWIRALLHANAEDWRNGKVYCNARDADTVRSIAGASFGGPIDCVGGILIESADGSHRTDLRFETLLADVWRDSIREVAEVLWPPR